MNEINWDMTEEATPEVTETVPDTTNVSVMKLDEAKALILKEFSAAVDDLVRQAAEIKVENDESAKRATEIGALAKRIMKGVDAEVDKQGAEAKDFLRKLKAFGESFSGRCSIVYNKVVGKLTEYRNWQELERRKQEELARKAAEEMQRKINEEAKAAGVEAPEVVTTTIIPEKPVNVKTEAGSTAFVGGRWKCTVTDETAVPREYCSPDSKKLNAAVRAGVRQIEGCEIKKDEKVRIRA